MSLDSKLNLTYVCANCSLTVPSHLLKLHSQSSPDCQLFHFHNLKTQESLNADLTLFIKVLKKSLSRQKFLNPVQVNLLKAQKKNYQDIVIKSIHTLAELETLENFILNYRSHLKKGTKIKMLICDILLLFKKTTKHVKLKNHSIKILENRTGLMLTRENIVIIAAEAEYLAINNQDNKVIILNKEENSIKSVFYLNEKKFHCFILVPRFSYFVYLNSSHVCFWDFEKSEHYRLVPRDCDSVQDRIYHSKTDQIIILFSLSTFYVWDVKNLQVIQRFSDVPRVKLLHLSLYFDEFVYYLCELNDEIWKVGLTNNEFIVNKKDVISLLPLSNNKIGIFIFRSITDCELIVFDTILRTELYLIALNFLMYQELNHFQFIENKDLILIKSLVLDLSSNLCYNKKIANRPLRYHHIKYKLFESKFKPIGQLKNIFTEISEYYLNKNHDHLFALCLKSDTKYLLVHNLHTSVNSFYRISSHLNSLSLSMPNYIIFNYNQFFVFWNMSKAEIDSVFYFDNEIKSKNKPLNIEFNLKKFNNDWRIINGKYLAHSIKAKTKIEIFRLNRMGMEVFGNSEYVPLELGMNEVLSVFNGWARVLSLENGQIQGVRVSDLDETCKFFTLINEFYVIIAYSYRTIAISIQKFEICSEARHDLIEKIFLVQNFSCVDAVVAHETNKVIVFLLRNKIEIFEIRYKFNENELKIKLTEDKKNFLFFNKNVMLILNLETGKENLIQYNSNKVYIEKLKIVNCAWVILFVKPEKSIISQITEKSVKIESNSSKFKIFLVNIQDPELHTYFLFADIPNIKRINSEFLLIYDSTDAFIVWIKEKIVRINLTSKLLTFIQANNYQGQNFAKLIISYFESGEINEQYEGKLMVVNFAKVSQDLVLLSSENELIIMNLQQLSIKIYTIPVLSVGISNIFYSYEENSLVIVESSSIRTLNFSDSAFTTLFSDNRFTNNYCSTCKQYIIVNYCCKTTSGMDNLIIDQRTLCSPPNIKSLTINKITIFSLEDCFLFTQERKIFSMKPFCISKNLALQSGQKNCFEYFYVFKKNFSVLNEKKTLELKIFFDLHQKYLVLTYDDNFYIINTNDLEITLSLGPSIINKLTCIKFSQNGEFIIFSNDQGIVYSWNTSTNSLSTYICHFHPINLLSITINNSHFLSYSKPESRILKTSLK